MFRILICWLLVCLGIPQAHAELMPTRLEVVASNYPLAYFAERIAGSSAVVHFPVPDDVDPAYWRPKVDDIKVLQRADLLVFNGAGYETWLPKVSLSRSRQVDTSLAFANQFIRIEQAVTHDHGGSGLHTHEGTAFTTWLDMSLAQRQAEAMAEALGRKQPELKSRFKEHLGQLLNDLEDMDKTLYAIGAKMRDYPLLASHPVYQYMARRYGLNLASVHWEPDEIPPEREWTQLAKVLEKHPAHWMIWEKQPQPETAKRLARLGINSLVFDPCANRPTQGDFLSVMATNVRNLQQAMKR
jgi:zinc transport system substrate-binding protein